MEITLSKSLEASGVRFIRVLWCDNANIIRAKAIHIGALEHHFEHGVGISVGQQGVPAMYDAVVPESGLGPVGEIRLVPDWSTVMQLPYAPSHARTLGDMVKDGQPWSLCPRYFLKRMIALAAKEGLEVKAAFENEFYLLKPSDNALGFAPTDNTLFASTLAMDLHQMVIDEIAEALIAQDIPVEQYYPESGPGQQEITMRYTNALPSADRQIVFRETVYAIAAKHGLKASFLPKIFADKAGSGCHIHLSLWREGQNLIPDSTNSAGISQTALAFIAGILHHLPALMALTTPSTNSYRRIHPHYWSGAFRAWGVDNREASVRVPTDPASGSANNFEIKTVDASANPYLALGAIIAAGLDGVRRGLNPGEPVTIDPGYLPQAEMKERGIDPLPTSLGEAIAHLNQNELLLNALGSELAKAYLAVRSAEWQALKDLDIEEEVKLLIERY